MGPLLNVQQQQARVCELYGSEHRRLLLYIPGRPFDRKQEFFPA